jgi:hypothetical protein
VQQATRRGLDPQLIARLLEAGPKEAAPVLEAIVSDHSGRLIKMANQSEATLRDINAKVLEFTALTQIALQARITTGNDQLIKDLGSSMRIASESMAEGAHSTASKVAKNLHIPLAEVRRIADEFSIDFQGELNGKHPVIHVTARLANNPLGTGKLAGTLGIITSDSNASGKATGGAVVGPGTGTSDSILTRLSTGEHVWTAAEVGAAGGHAAVEAMRRSVLAYRSPWAGIPGYAHGGPVTQPSTAGTQVVTVRIPVEERMSHHDNWGGVSVVAHDYDDFLAQMDRRHRIATAPDWGG